MNNPTKISPFKVFSIFFLLIFVIGMNTAIMGQDTSRSILDFNNTKIVKKLNSILDSNQKKVNKFIFNKADSLKSTMNKSVNNALPKEIEKPLPYERLLNKKYTLGRRAYQNTVAH